MKTRGPWRRRSGKRTACIAIAWLLALTVLLVGSAVASAGTPASTEINKYLIVGMRNTGDDAVNVSKIELGANSIFLSNTGGLDIVGTFFNGGLRWPSQTAPPSPAAPVMTVPPDDSGNIAVTSTTGFFSLSDIDLHASIGVHCANATPANCDQSVSGTTWFIGGISQGAVPANGVFNFAPTDLLTEIGGWKTFIQGLIQDTKTSNGTFFPGNTSGDWQSIAAGGTGPLVVDLNAIDAAGNSDGIAVIDYVDDGTDFDISESDVIFQGDANIFGIVRVTWTRFVLSV